MYEKMSFLKSKKMKAVALTLVVALMGGLVYNAGAFDKAKASEVTNQLVGMSYEELSELDENELQEIVKEMNQDDLADATEKFVIEAAKAAAKEQAPELELEAKISAAVYDNLTDKLVGYEVSYFADEVPYGYVVVDSNVENSVSDFVIEENVPSLFNQLTSAYSAVSGSDKEADCQPVLYATYTGKYAVSSVNSDAKEFFFDSAIYSEDEFKALVETNSQNPTEKGLGTIAAIGGFAAVGTLVAANVAVNALEKLILYIWNNK